MKTNRTLLVTAIVIAIFPIVLSSVSCSVAAGPQLPLYRVSEEMFYDKLLLIRRASPNGHLLLKILNEDKVFLYDIDKKTVTQVDVLAWHGSTEKVSVCDSTIGTRSENEQSFNTSAKYALAFNESPDRSKVAVYTAAGPKTPGFSIFPGLGGGSRYYGQRYIEIKTNDTHKSDLAEPVRVQDLTAPGLCWSHDEDIVLLYDTYHFDFSVLDLNPQKHAGTPPVVAAQSQTGPDLSRFTGIVRDQGIDENGDGLFEKISVEVETETTIPGKYIINISLRSRKGNHYSTGKEVELKGGKETTKFVFDTKPMFEAGDDGAFEYALNNLIYRYGVDLDFRQDAGTTHEYKLSQFQRPVVIRTGKNSVTPIDNDNNGKFESLEIKVGVDSLYPGSYEYQGDLYDGVSDSTNEGLIEIGSGKAYLKKGPGELTFLFKGKKIIEHGVSGRFKLRFVVISMPGERPPLTDTVLKTDSYEIDQFEAASK